MDGAQAPSGFKTDVLGQVPTALQAYVGTDVLKPR